MLSPCVPKGEKGEGFNPSPPGAAGIGFCLFEADPLDGPVLEAVVYFKPDGFADGPEGKVGAAVDTAGLRRRRS